MLANRVRAALGRTNLSLSDIAEKLGVDYMTILRLRQGRRIKPVTIALFAEIVGEDPAELVDIAYPELAKAIRREPVSIPGAGEPQPLHPSTARLPVAGTLRGGVLTGAEEEPGEYMPCLPEHAALADFVVRIEGDSLWPLVLPGDYIAIRKTSTVRPGDLVVVKVGDEQTVVKRFGGRREGKVILESINPIYPPIHAEHAEIVGVAAWVHRTAETVRRFGR